jgi:AcrR family transcriptional regulator
MTDTFTRLPEEKKNRIIMAGIREFGHQGYEHGSLDRVVRQSGISKGGFYEYTPSKEDFFLFLVDRVYNGLYRFLEERIGPAADKKQDILARMENAARNAVDYYFDHPDCVRLLERNIRLEDQNLSEKVNLLFRRHFDRLFTPGEGGNLRYSEERVMDLLRWILLKTRSTFLRLLDSGAGPESIRKDYLSEWEFHMSVLRNGLYKS